MLWLNVSKSLLGYDLILGAVYLPHETSVYYSDDVFGFLIDDMTTIRAKYDVHTILWVQVKSLVGQKPKGPNSYGQKSHGQKPNHLTAKWSKSPSLWGII